jgi:hypothetical protein
VAGPQQDISAFLSAVATTPGLWAALDDRSVAVQVGEKWHNLLTRCQLTGRAPEEVPRFEHLPTTKLIACRQAVLPISQLEDFLVAAGRGEVEIGDAHIFFVGQQSGNAPETPYPLSYCYFESDFGASSDAFFRTGHALQLSASSCSELFSRVPGSSEAIERGLRGLEQPWDGLDSLAKYFIGTEGRLDHSATLRLEVIAPLEARFEHCALKGGTLTVHVTAGRRPVTERCTLGLFGTRVNRMPFAETLHIRPDQWQPKAANAVHIWEGTHQLDRALWATLLLRVGPSVVERRTVTDPVGVGGNARLEAYRVFDSGAGWLTHLLTEPLPSEKDDFHRAVARLFTFLGFYVDSFVGEKKLEGLGIVDFLAHAPLERCLFVVECTTGQLASKDGKLGKLVTRARDIQDALRSVSADEVLPVMVTSLLNVPDYELEDAATDGVAVLTQPNLDELLLMAKRQAPLEQVVAWCKARVPPRQSHSKPPIFPR